MGKVIGVVCEMMGGAHRRILSCLARDQAYPSKQRLGDWITYEMQPNSLVLHDHFSSELQNPQQAQNLLKKKLLGQFEPVLYNYIMKVVITPCLHLCFVINSPL